MNSKPDEASARPKFGNLGGWIVFLFGQYCVFCMAFDPICCEWHYAQLLFLVPGILVAYWIRNPGKKRAGQTLNERLIVGGVSLIGAMFLGGVTELIKENIHIPTQTRAAAPQTTSDGHVGN